MKKIKLLITALTVLGFTLSYGQEGYYLPSQMVNVRLHPTSQYRFITGGPIDSVKFKKLSGSNALVTYYQTTTDSTWIKIQTSATPNFLLAHGNTIPYSGETIGVRSDSVLVPDTTVSYVRIISYSDSGTTPVDTTPPVLLKRDASIPLYSVTPIIGGTAFEMRYDPGNSLVIPEVWLSIVPDTTFQFPVPFIYDTTFSIGTQLILRDTINGISSPSVPTGFCIRMFVHQLEGNTVYVSDCAATLSNGVPSINWYGIPASDDHSIQFATVEERYGVPSIRKIYIENMTTGHIDSIITNLPAASAGQLIANVDQQGLPANTQFMLYGNLSNINGTSFLTPIYIFTLPPAPVLSISIQNIAVSTDVVGTFNYSNNPGHTCNATVGYGMFGSSVLMYSANYPNNANAGSFPSMFPLPPTTGQYTMRADAYDEQIITTAVPDTQSFIVSSLTGEDELVWTNPYSLITKIEVLDLQGRLIYTQIGEGLIPRLRTDGILFSKTLYVLRAYNKNGEIAYIGKLYSR